MLNHEINRAFRARLGEKRAILMPGAANALAARIIAERHRDRLARLRAAPDYAATMAELRDAGA